MINELIEKYIEELSLKRQELIDTRDNKIKQENQILIDFKNPRTLREKLLLKLTNKRSFSRELEISEKEEECEKNINIIKYEYNQLIKEIDEILKLHKDNDFIIDTILSKNRELLKNPEFIIELIKINPKYIMYDQTNNIDVYKTFFSSLAIIDGNNKSIYHKILNELNNPRVPDNDKYKIKYEFLFEAIRKSIMSKIKQSYEYGNTNIFDGLISIINRYILYDCSTSKTYGDKIEELYTSNNSLYTAICYPEVIDKILQQGYQINYGGDLSRNLYSRDDININFFTFFTVATLSSGGKSCSPIVSIPYDAQYILGSNGNVGTYGAIDSQNRENRSEIDRTYILPEYLVGYIIRDNDDPMSIHFVDNPIPLEERDKYKNLGNPGKDFTYVDDLILGAENSPIIRR